MKTLLSAAVLGATLTIGTLTGAAAPASADTPRCVTFKEFQQIDKGMKKARVHRIFGIRGQSAGGFAGGYTRWYPSCQAIHSEGSDAGASVSYDGRTNRVVEKRWV